MIHWPSICTHSPLTVTSPCIPPVLRLAQVFQHLASLELNEWNIASEADLFCHLCHHETFSKGQMFTTLRVEKSVN